MKFSDATFLVRKIGTYRLVHEYLRTTEIGLFITNKRDYARRITQPFSFVGLMLSRECKANCIFCPIPRHADLNNNNPFMPFDIARKVIDQLAQSRFNGQVNFGENGDCFLNPEFAQIYLYASQKLPNASLMVYSNMQNCTPEMSELMLNNRLSYLNCNIDGASEKTFRISKPGLEYQAVHDNLQSFIEKRNRFKRDCTVGITIVTPRRYFDMRRNGVHPEIQYDAAQIRDYWGRYLSLRDQISETIWIYNWNKRLSARKNVSCSPEIATEFFSTFFISTEGRAYVCCFDYNTRMTYGNICEESMHSLWKSRDRKRILTDILNKNFDRVGEPCLHCAEKYDFLDCLSNYLKYQRGSTR